MESSYRSVKVVYTGRGRDILWWCISTAFFSLITLGLYLPVGINRLVRYIFENTEVHIQGSTASQTGDTVSTSAPSDRAA